MKYDATTSLPKSKLEQIQRALKLDYIPTNIPYDYHGLGLALPERLTNMESRQVFGSILVSKSSMHQGDFFNWCDAHPEGPHLSYDVVRKIFQALFRKSSFFNRKSVAKRVPLSERLPGLTFEHYDAVAKLPPENRRRLLVWATIERVSPRELRIEAAGEEERIRSGVPATDAPPLRHPRDRFTDHLIETCRQLNRLARLTSDKAVQDQLRFLHEGVTEIIPLARRLASVAPAPKKSRSSRRRRTSDGPNDGHADRKRQRMFA